MKKANSNKVTARDVAEHLGISQSTVSRVFNKNWKGNLSDDIKKRVKDASKELGYYPNAIANILHSNRSNLVGIVVSSVFDSFYGEVLITLNNIFGEYGYQTMLFTCAPTQDINEILDRCMQYRLDAIVITSAALTHNIATNFTSRDIPIMLYNGYIEGLEANCVHSDNQAGCMAIADLFAELGHKKIAYFTTGASKYGTYELRKVAFLKGLAQNGISECQTVDAYYLYEKTLVIARDYFKNNDNPPEAIFCSGDENTFAVIDAAAENGLIAGKDISVAGFYAPGMQFRAYDITCLKQDIHSMARNAVEKICSLIDNPTKDFEIITHPMTVYLGKSTIPKP